MRRADAKPGPSTAAEACGKIHMGTCIPFISLSVYPGVSSIPNLQGNLHSSPLPIGLVFILKGI